jgi:hypothetical protein
LAQLSNSTTPHTLLQHYSIFLFCASLPFQFYRQHLLQRSGHHIGIFSFSVLHYSIFRLYVSALSHTLFYLSVATHYFATCRFLLFCFGVLL